MIKAEGHGQSECYECKKQGKWSLNWTSFMYKTDVDNFEHIYCYECCKNIEERGINIE